jgi:hypothetical protein
MNHNNQWMLVYVINIIVYINAIVLNVIGILFCNLSMICPSCLMFDSHKGHLVCRIEEGSKDLRTKINSAAKDGLLKF